MANFLSVNLIYIRKQRKITQAEAALQLSLKRNTYANYESQHTQPDIGTLLTISKIWGISLDDLLMRDLSKGNLIHFSETQEKRNLIGNPIGNPNRKYSKNETVERVTMREERVEDKLKAVSMPRVVTIDSTGNENILYVPIKARAGYLLGYGDAEFIETLPTFNMPGLKNDSYRAFEVEGNSMFSTLHDRDMVIARWERVSEIIDDRVYVLVTQNEGVCIKRLINRFQDGVVIAKSDNNHLDEYPALTIEVHDVREAWYVVGSFTRQLARPGEIYKRLISLEADMELLKRALKGK